MTTVNFSKALKNAKGEEQKEIQLNEILADFMASESKGPARKMYAWVTLLGAGEPLVVDKEDLKTIEKTIEESDRITTLVKGQLLELIDEAKEAKRGATEAA